jgi:hypothetical protein
MEGNIDKLNKNIDKLLPLIVNPTPINFGSLAPNKSIVMPILICNPNVKPIIWTADEHETSWLMLEEITGTLQPGARREIKIVVKTSSMRQGSYTATVTFTSDVNDEFVSVHVPVLLTITTAYD